MADKKLRITVEAFTGQAAAQLKSLGMGLQGVKKEVGGVSGAGGMLRNVFSFGAAIIGVQTLTAALSGLKTAVVGTFQSALKQIEDFNLGVIGTAGALTSLAANPSQAAFRQNLDYTREAMERLQIVAAKYIASGQEINIVFQTMAQRGIVPITEKDFDNLGRITDAVKIMTQGQDFSRQGWQEIRSIIEGTVLPGSLLARQIEAQVGNLKEWVALHKKAGDLIPAIAEKVIGLSYAQSEVLKLSSTWKSTLETIFGLVSRRAFAGVYQDITKTLERISGLFLDQEGQLTNLSRLIIEKVKGAWDKVKKTIKVDIFEWIQLNAPSIIDNLAIGIEKVAIAAQKIAIFLGKAFQFAQWIAGINIAGPSQTQKELKWLMEKRTALGKIEAAQRGAFTLFGADVAAGIGLKNKKGEWWLEDVSRGGPGGIYDTEVKILQKKAQLAKETAKTIRESREAMGLIDSDFIGPRVPEKIAERNRKLREKGGRGKALTPAALGVFGGEGEGGGGGATAKGAQKIAEQAYKFLQSLEVDFTRITKGEAAARLLSLRNEYREKIAEAIKFKASEADMAKLTAVFEAEKTKIKKEEAEKQKKIGADYRASVLSNEESLRRSLAALTTTGYDLEILQANQALQDRLNNNKKIYDDAVAAGIKSADQLKMLEDNFNTGKSLAVAIYVEDVKKADKDRVTNATSAAQSILAENQNLLESIMKGKLSAVGYDKWAEGERYRIAVDAVNQRITLIIGEGEAEIQQKTLLHQQIELLGQDHAARMKAIAEAQGGEWAKMWQDTAKQAAASLASIIAYAGNFKDWFSNLWRGLVYKVLFKIFDDMVDKWLESMAKMAAAQVGGGFLSGLLGGILGAIFPPAKILTAPLGGGAVMAQHGGLVPGMGSGDTVPAMLEPGELVTPRTVVTTVSRIMGAEPPLYPSTGLSFWKDFIKTLALGKVKGGVMKAAAGGLVPGYRGEKQTSPSWLSSLLETGRQAMPRISSSEFGKIPRYSSGANFFQGFMDLIRGGASPPMLQLAAAGGGHTINVQVNTYGNNYSQADAESIADTVQERIAQKLWGNR